MTYRGFLAGGLISKFLPLKHVPCVFISLAHWVFNMKTLCTLRYFALQKTSVLREVMIAMSIYSANKVCGIQPLSAWAGCLTS